MSPLQSRLVGRFQTRTPTTRSMAVVIAVATFVVSLLAGVVMRLVDSNEYGSIWEGLYWAVQTVTTVGYGDVAPVNGEARALAVLVMALGPAYIAVLTAVITTIFIEDAQRRRAKEEAQAPDGHGAEAAGGQGAEAQWASDAFADIQSRLEKIEHQLARLSAGDS